MSLPPPFSPPVFPSPCASSQSPRNTHLSLSFDDQSVLPHLIDQRPKTTLVSWYLTGADSLFLSPFFPVLLPVLAPSCSFNGGQYFFSGVKCNKLRTWSSGRRTFLFARFAIPPFFKCLRATFSSPAQSVTFRASPFS